MQATRRLELENACAIHGNIRSEYLIAYMLHQEALKAAQSSEKRANEALSKLQDISARVTACMATAFCDLEIDEKPGSDESGSEDSGSEGSSSEKSSNDDSCRAQNRNKCDDYTFHPLVCRLLVDEQHTFLISPPGQRLRNTRRK